MKGDKRNPIQEYLMENTDRTTIASRELFTANDKDIKLKTELSGDEIIHISTLFFNDSVLKKAGLEPIYTDFLQDFMRLKVSFERKGRGEFVKINSGDKTEEMLNNFGNLSNILGAKK